MLSHKKTYHSSLPIENKEFAKIFSLTGNDIETSELLYSIQCSALIKRTLSSCAKVVFFSLITKTIPMKNGENRTSKYNFYYPSILKVM